MRIGPFPGLLTLPVLLTLSGVLLSCVAPPFPLITPIPDSVEISHLIREQLEAGVAVTEVEPLQKALPEEIVAAQLDTFFHLGELAFALVRQPSMNVPLSIPEGHSPDFVGLLVSVDGGAWQKYLEISDRSPTDQNNPYYLWDEDGNLYLSIVDQTGAGSGQGIMKVLRFTPTAEWDGAECYYFGGKYRGPEVDGDYFAYSKLLTEQKREAGERCRNVKWRLSER